MTVKMRINTGTVLLAILMVITTVLLSCFTRNQVTHAFSPTSLSSPRPLSPSSQKSRLSSRVIGTTTFIKNHRTVRERGMMGKLRNDYRRTTKTSTNRYAPNVVAATTSSQLLATVETPPPSPGEEKAQKDPSVAHSISDSSSSSSDSTKVVDDEDENNPFKQFYRLPKTAYKIYTSYAKQLWKDTDTSARTRIANDKVRSSVRNLLHLLQQAEEYNNNSNNKYKDASNRKDSGKDNGDGTTTLLGRVRRRGRSKKEDEELVKAQQELLVACDKMLAALPQDEDDEEEITLFHQESSGEDILQHMTDQNRHVDGSQLHDDDNNVAITLASNGEQLQVATTTTNNNNNNGEPDIAVMSVESSSSKEVAIINDDTSTESLTTSPAPKKKKQRSILFGVVMGAVVAAWVFSGNYIFTGVFCLMTILGQLEYYRMVMNTGVFPARRISVIGATSMFVTVSLKRNICCHIRKK